MNELKGKKCVLSGGIDRCKDDGVGWRKYVREECEKKGIDIDFFDPCDKPNGLGSEIGVEKTKVRELINDDKWEEAREYVKTFRHYDLKAVDWSDFVIVKIDSTYEPFYPALNPVNNLLTNLACANTKGKNHKSFRRANSIFHSLYPGT